MSFADHEGFRCGICFPYKSFDLTANRNLDIWELSLTIMDRSLFDYQSLTPEEGFERIKNRIDTVEKHNGVFVLLWYNSSLDNIQYLRWPEVCERTIDYIAKQNVFCRICKEVIQYWEKNT